MHDVLASDVDAVYIATPPYLHPEHFEAAVASRKHIFMEKPAGVDPAGCKRVLAAAKKADPKKRITVDYQQRYGKDYRKAYAIVKSGELGGIKQIRASWLGGGLPVREGHAANEEQMRNWLFYREKSGDIIVEQNCHNIDVVNWFMGTHPVKAIGYGGRAVRKNIGNIMDNLAATFHFADGTIFSYSFEPVRGGRLQGRFRDVHLREGRGDHVAAGLHALPHGQAGNGGDAGPGRQDLRHHGGRGERFRGRRAHRQAGECGVHGGGEHADGDHGARSDLQRPRVEVERRQLAGESGLRSHK